MSRPDPTPDVPLRLPLGAIAALFLASIALRPQILSIGPLLPFIRTDLDLAAGVAGLLTTIPVLCMGIFAPFGPLIAARLGARTAFAVCLTLIGGFGLARAGAPNVPLILLTTLGIGIGIGMAGAIPSMVVSQRISMRPALGTGAYAGGIVLGSAIAAAVAVPLAGPAHEWRQTLLIVSIVTFLPIAAWLILIRPDPNARPLRARAPHLPWRSRTGWLLVVVFGLQSLLFYGVVAWLPNVFVERGWSPAEAGALIGLFNGVGLLTTIGVPLVADRLGTRRGQLVLSAMLAVVSTAGIAAVSDLAVLWVVLLGLALGTIFPLVLTLPIDVADEPAQVGSVAALMLLGGYLLSALGPVVLGAARDVTGDFEVSLWILVAVGVGLTACCLALSPARLRRGIRRQEGVFGS